VSAFETALNAAVGNSADAGDIRAALAFLYEYAFITGPVRLWRGQGLLTTSDGRQWLGTVDGNGNDFHQVPPLGDGRDGSAQQLEFGFPYLDAATFRALKANPEAVSGCAITCLVAIVLDGEGLNPRIAPDYVAGYVMQSATFSHKPGFDPASGTTSVSYSIRINAKDRNAGVSQATGGTYTDTWQQKKAQLLGVDPDYGCGFVVQLANETIQFP
jgi:hypothetical protein